MKKLAIILAALLLFSLMAGTALAAGADGEYPVAEGVPETFEEALEYYKNGRIGVQTGSTMETVAAELFPEADLQYFSTAADLKAALLGGKIDAFVLDSPVALTMRQEDPSVTYYADLAGAEEIAFAFNRDTGTELCAQMNDFLAGARESGLIDELTDKWFDYDGTEEISVDINSLSGENGTLEVVSEIAYAPFEFFTNSGNYGGFELELLMYFAEEYGYSVNLSNVAFSTVILSISSGKADMAASGLSITEERKESVLFSDPFYTSGGVLCVPSGVKTGGTFLENLGDSLQKTFVTADRWKLFLNGLATTLVICLLSALLGTVGGFGIFSVYRKGNRAFCRVTDALSGIIHGMPVVVFLLLVYYLVFGSSRLDGRWVSVVAFTVLFSFDTADLLTNGSRLVDRGQTEAAYMLGYGERSAFYRIILPQIINNSMPGYIGAVTALLHSTAIVGYVAVEDITKVSDIIRSRTYEAFFPLIVTALAYFLIAWLITALLRELQRKIDPRTRKINIKGENADD